MVDLFGNILKNNWIARGVFGLLFFGRGVFNWRLNVSLSRDRVWADFACRVSWDACACFVGIVVEFG